MREKPFPSPLSAGGPKTTTSPAPILYAGKDFPMRSYPFEEVSQVKCQALAKQKKFGVSAANGSRSTYTQFCERLRFITTFFVG